MSMAIACCDLKILDESLGEAWKVVGDLVKQCWRDATSTFFMKETYYCTYMYHDVAYQATVEKLLVNNMTRRVSVSCYSHDYNYGNDHSEDCHRIHTQGLDNLVEIHKSITEQVPVCRYYPWTHILQCKSWIKHDGVDIVFVVKFEGRCSDPDIHHDS